jgi:thymidylate kinase
MDKSRLIFVEGIMGSGKSTTARWLARLIRRTGIPARPVPEARPHPTNVFRTLPHWKLPWLDLTPEELMTRSYANWKTFVAKALSRSQIFVFDGQLFHGDFTSLFLMGCSPEVLNQYVHTVLQLAQPLHPIIIYCYQTDVAQALDRIGAQRGQGWVESQVAWKLASPYGQQRGLAGIDGWKQLYQDYRQLTDMCSQMLTIPKIAIETSAGEWSSYQTRIRTFLNLPFIPEPVWQRWFYKVYDYLVDIR